MWTNFFNMSVAAISPISVGILHENEALDQVRRMRKRADWRVEDDRFEQGRIIVKMEGERQETEKVGAAKAEGIRREIELAQMKTQLANEDYSRLDEFA